MRKIIYLILVAGLLYCDNTEEKIKTTIDERIEINKKYQKKEFVVSDVSNFEFYVIADTHYGKKYKIHNSLSTNYVRNRIPDYSKVFINGDILIRGSSRDWFVYNNDVAKTNYNIYGVIGNHDIDVNIQRYNRVFGKTIYDYVVGDTQIIVLDTGDKIVGVTQLEWLEGKLKNSTSKNIIILTHVPCSYMHRFGEHKLQQLCIDYSVKLCVYAHAHARSSNVVGNTTFETISSISMVEDKQVLKIKIANDVLSWKSL